MGRTRRSDARKVEAKTDLNGGLNFHVVAIRSAAISATIIVMVGRRSRNHSGLFNLFSHDKPDKTGTILQNIGKIFFTVSFTANIFVVYINDDNSKAFTTFLTIFGTGYFIGLFAFIAAGVHYIGRKNGKNSFLSSAVYVAKNAFIYLFLPAIIITAAIIIWAIVTEQPAFR